MPSVCVFAPKKECIKLKIEDTRGGVDLVAVDNEGNTVSHGKLLRITNEGRIYRYGCVGEKLGFKLDQQCRIMLDEGE